MLLCNRKVSDFINYCFYLFFFKWNIDRYKKVQIICIFCITFINSTSYCILWFCLFVWFINDFLFRNLLSVLLLGFFTFIIAQELLVGSPKLYDLGAFLHPYVFFFRFAIKRVMSQFYINNFFFNILDTD